MLVLFITLNYSSKSSNPLYFQCIAYALFFNLIQLLHFFLTYLFTMLLDSKCPNESSLSYGFFNTLFLTHPSSRSKDLFVHFHKHISIHSIDNIFNWNPSNAHISLLRQDNHLHLGGM